MRIVDKCGAYNIVIRKNPRFKQLDPIPSKETLDEFYKNLYYEEHKSGYIEQDNQDEIYLRIPYEDRVHFLKKLKVGKHILDVGCGAGMFMDYAVNYGFVCHGIEPSKTASAVVKKNGHEIFVGILDDYVKQHEGNLFDVVHLKNVLEHVRSPIETLQHCHDLLKPGGILYIEVPNDYNLLQMAGHRLLGMRKSWISPPDHIQYFNFRSLNHVLKHCGFAPKLRFTTFPMYLLPLLGFNFVKNPAKGPCAHRIRVNFETKMHQLGLNGLRRKFYRMLSTIGLGRTAIYFCAKQ